MLRAEMLYIFWFLHQTTTTNLCNRKTPCCISFDSYIKPQLYHCSVPSACSCISFDSYIKPQQMVKRNDGKISCISFDSYIKPQLSTPHTYSVYVVYLLIPTSNHNSMCIRTGSSPVVYLLIPTSNHNSFKEGTYRHFVVYLLIPTSNHNAQQPWVPPYELYIFWFLHQTTTYESSCLSSERCISFDSYIKPQHESNM